MTDPSRVVEAGLCIGCGVCAWVYPGKVELREEAGFITPHVTQALSSVEEASFADFCPGLGYKAPARLPGAASDPIWGQYFVMRSAWAADVNLRRLGSSGGALSALASFLLSSRRVDAVVGVSQHPGSAIRNQSVVIREPSEVHRLTGSRYGPAAPFMALDALGADDRVAVVGKPCDVAGLRAFYSGSPDGVPRVEYLLSFFCAGTPSLDATRQLVTELGLDADRLMRLRYRGDGWPGWFSASDSSGRSASVSYEESWGGTLNKHLHTRCKLCRDGIGSQADVVAADNWETDGRGYPLFTDRPGESLLISRTERGEELVCAAAETHLKLGRFRPERLARMQAYQAERNRQALPRRIGFRFARREAPKFRGYPATRWIVRYPVQSLRQMVGAYRRARVRGG